jgi:hypothetical protein
MMEDKSKKTSGMSEEAKRTVAKEYVDKQLALLKQHGTLRRVSKSTYNSIVNQVVRVTR